MIETGKHLGSLKVVGPCVAAVAVLILLVPAQAIANWEEDIDGDVEVDLCSHTSLPRGNVLPDVDGTWSEGYAETEVLTGMWVYYFWDPDTNTFEPGSGAQFGEIHSSGHDVFEWTGEDTSTGGTAYYTCTEYVTAGSSIEFYGASNVRGITQSQVECSVSGAFPSSLWAESRVEAYWFGVDDAYYDYEPKNLPYPNEWGYGITYPVYNQNEDSIYGSCGAYVHVSLGSQHTQIPAGTLIFGLTDIEVMSLAGAAMETDNSECAGSCISVSRSHITWDLSYSEQ